LRPDNSVILYSCGLTTPSYFTATLVILPDVFVIKKFPEIKNVP